MKEVLMVGNSQLGVLRRAYLNEKNVALADVASVSFFATPGGSGPYVRAENRKLVATQQVKQERVFWAPPDAEHRPLASFDAIVVSALGFIDDGKIGIPAISRVRLSPFEPIGQLAAPFVSEACFRELACAMLDTQPGFVFLRDLRQIYDGQIIVQPFPHLPASVITRAEWGLAARYRNAIGVYRLLSQIKDTHLANTCKALDATLLDYPYPDLRSSMFTPDELIDPVDLIHPTAEYGVAVLGQIAAALNGGARKVMAPVEAVG